MIEEFEYTGKAMGTDYSIAIVGHSAVLAKEMFASAKAEIEAYEARFSRFLPTSELSVLNDKKNMVVSEIFLAVTQRAYELFAKTAGIFNPLVQVVRLGYNQTFDGLNKNQSTSNEVNDDDNPYDIDFTTTAIDTTNSRIILKAGQKLDFGGFLKGYLAEMIAKRLFSDYLDVVGVIVNLGGDIHTQGLDKNQEKFLFSIYNPVLDNEDTMVPLYNQSLATSGIYKRAWLRNGEKTHHILDASGKQNPVTDIVSASVIHESGASAEAFAKVLLSIGVEKALSILGTEKLSFSVINTTGEMSTNIL